MQQVRPTVWQRGAAQAPPSVQDRNGNRIAEVAHNPATGASTLLREYLWADDLAVAVREGGQTYYLHVDHIGRPVLATNQAGAVVGRASYTPFGGIQSVSVTPDTLSAQELRFPGQWFQAGEPGQGSRRWRDPPANGLPRNWMRDYDPTTGRYLQADPLGLIDGASVYGYVNGNPVNLIDPLGLRSLTDREKKMLSPYIPQIDLENADLHEDGTPWWVKSSARAVTLGNDIYFRDGAPDTCSPGGLALLGHELVHVGQFRNGMTWLGYTLDIERYENPAYKMRDQIKNYFINNDSNCGCDEKN